MTEQLWSDQRIYLEFFSHLCMADQIVTSMRDEYEAELEKARATSDTWHASYCRVQTENNDLKEMLATEIAATVALRTELAAANAKVAELTEKLRSEGYNV